MKTIENFDLSGKKVIIRVDFNVPIKDGVITDDNRIKESLCMKMAVMTMRTISHRARNSLSTSSSKRVDTTNSPIITRTMVLAAIAATEIIIMATSSPYHQLVIELKSQLSFTPLVFSRD